MRVNPFTDSSNITIRLIRQKHTDTSEEDMDDRIAIVHQGDSLYHLYYKDANTKENGVTHVSVLTGEELDQYLYGLFFLLSRDKDPFRSIQFNIPCMPSFLFLIEDLRKNGLKEALNTVLPLMCSCLKTRI